MQSLYEKKLVTYPRTDSQYLSDDMEQTAYSLIPAISEHFEFGRVENPNLKAVINNSKVTGHHAIISTESGVKCDISALAVGEQNILKLVALRLLCASASAYKYGSVKVKLLCENTEFTATGRTVLESGWKALDSKIGEAEKSDEKSLPNLENGMTFTAKASKSEHFAMPYLSGPDLCGLSTLFGFPTTYSSGGVNLSRWQYLDNLMIYCIKENRFSDLLAYLFDKKQFSKMLSGHEVDEINEAYDHITKSII